MRHLKSIFFTILIFFTLVGVGQTNLVVNPSFEDTVACPSNQDEVYNAEYWGNYSNQSPDYFNSCTSNSDIDVPNNWASYQPASSGNAYCAVSAFFPSTPNKREVIGSSLSESLIIGSKYYFSMKINLGINPASYPTYACSGMGMRVSTVPYSISNPAPIDNSPHVWTDSIITDTTNWTTIFGSFIADSAYSYIALGNFFDDSNIDTLKMVSGTPPFIFAYYYIDDVCLSTDSSFTANYIYTGIEESNLEGSISLYPNPVNDYFIINQPFSEPYDLIIYNALGQKLFQETNITTSDKTINTHTFSNGVLLVHIRTRNQNFIYKLLKR